MRNEYDKIHVSRMNMPYFHDCKSHLIVNRKKVPNYIFIQKLYFIMQELNFGVYRAYFGQGFRVTNNQRKVATGQSTFKLHSNVSRTPL